VFEHLNTQGREIIGKLCAGRSVELRGRAAGPFGDGERQVLRPLALYLSGLGTLIDSIEEAGIDELSAELRVLMPAREQHIRFGKNANLIHVLSV